MYADFISAVTTILDQNSAASHVKLLNSSQLALSTPLQSYAKSKNLQQSINQSINQTNVILTVKNRQRSKFNKRFTDDDIRLFMFDRRVQRLECILF